MNLSLVSAGQAPPKDIHAVVAIALGGMPVTQESDDADTNEEILAEPSTSCTRSAPACRAKRT